MENTNYSLRTTAGDFILTLYEKRVDPADLPWFLGLMEHLARRGIVCPLPVHGRDGAGAAACCAGGMPRSPPSCPASGRAGCGWSIAGRSARRWPRCIWPARTTRRRGATRWARTAGRRCWSAAAARADEVQPGLAAELEAALARILAAWPAGLPVGHIHADLFPDNVFFLDGRLSGLIDFYFAATDILAYDIAVCLNAWCFEPDFSFNVTKARALLRGLRGDAAAVGGGARGAAGAVPGRGDPLPADPAVRLAEHAAGRAGDAQGPAGISAPPALPPGGRATSMPMDI